mgnify:FL=1
MFTAGMALMLFGGLFFVNRALAETAKPVTKAGERLVTIYDRGVERTIVTKARTVREALKLARLSIDERQDVVEPGLDSEMVAERYNVNIFRARPVTIVDGGKRLRVTTAQQTPVLIAKAAGLEIFNEDKTTLTKADNVAVDGADMVMRVERALAVNFILYGKTSTIRTHAKTVGELLKDKHITLKKDDTLSVDLSSKIVPGMKIELWRNGKQTVTVEEEVKFETEKIKDANRETSYREVKQAGENGKKNVTYEIEMKNGVEVSRKEIASVVTKESKKQIEIIGTKNAVMPYTGGGSKDQWLASSNIPRDQWGYAEWLVQKESGWNPNARSRSGACGLAQALPCSKVPGNPLNPADSLNWMHGYVMGRYGSWEKAVAHSKARGWY